MGQLTTIAWTDHTFNPWWGCTKITGPNGAPSACDHCYAADLAKRFGHNVWGKDAPRRFFGDNHWNEPIRWNREAEMEARQHRVFCLSMGDIFENREDLDEPRRRLYDLIATTPWLDWQLLTKRPELAGGLVPIGWNRHGWPTNVWLGTTVEDQQRADLRIPRLLRVPARVHFLSCEPLFGPIDLRAAVRTMGSQRGHGLFASYVHADGCCDRLHGIDWVIVGGESGAHHRPFDVDAARGLRDQCAAAGVPFFFKQHGGRTPTAGGDLLDGEQWKQFPRSSHGA